MPFYAVANGRVPGIYLTWEQCSIQVHKFKSAKYKKFQSEQDAKNFILQNKQGIKSDNKSINDKLIEKRGLSATLHDHSNSRESVIVEKVVYRSIANKLLKRNVSTRSQDETIYLSDDDQTVDSTDRPSISNRSENGSVILLDDDDTNLSKVIKKIHVNKVNNNATRSSPRRAVSTDNLTTAIKQSINNKINDENRSKNQSNTQKTNQQLRNRGHVVIYTDGACSNNGYANAKAGIGVWWGDNDSRNLSEPLTGRPTNNRAEIWAAVKAINKAAEEGYDSVTICSDSDFLIKSAKFWIYKWKNNNWQLPNNKRVKNKEDFIELIEAMNKIKVVWEKVKSHIGIKGNEEADRLAVAGMNKNS